MLKYGNISFPVCLQWRGSETIGGVKIDSSTTVFAPTSGTGLCVQRFVEREVEGEGEVGCERLRFIVCESPLKLQ